MGLLSLMSLKKGYPVDCFKGVVLMGVVLLASTANAADQRVCGDGQIVVKAALGQAVDITVENGVGDLVRSGDPATVKVEHTAGHLFLTPLTLFPADVTVIDMHGQSHLIRCVFEEPVDRKIVIGDCDPVNGAGRRQDSVMGLMRDLIQGRTFSGATRKTADEVLFDNGKVRMRAVLIQEMPELRGYAMVVENMTAGPVAIPVQQMAFPGLLAVSSSRDVLAKAEQGHIYMVVGR